jgi:hypothetical protein
MKKIVIYTRPELAAILTQATAGTTPAAWLTDARTTLAAMLKARPASYLSFGPWWWAVKAQLVAAGLIGGTVNDDLLAAIATGDAALDMAGALAYHGWNLDQMRDGNVFAVDTEDGDQVDYLLADDDMDALIGAAN